MNELKELITNALTAYEDFFINTVAEYQKNHPEAPVDEDDDCEWLELELKDLREQLEQCKTEEEINRTVRKAIDELEVG